MNWLSMWSTNFVFAVTFGRLTVAVSSDGTFGVLGVPVTCSWRKTRLPSAHNRILHSPPRRTHSALHACHQLTVIAPLSVVGLDTVQSQFGSSGLRSVVPFSPATATHLAAGPAERPAVWVSVEQTLALGPDTSTEPLPVQPLSSGGLPLKCSTVVASAGRSGILEAAVFGFTLDGPACRSTKSESNESLGLLAAEPVAEPLIVIAIPATMTQSSDARMILIRKLSKAVRGNESFDMTCLLRLRQVFIGKATPGSRCQQNATLGTKARLRNRT